MNKQTKLLLFLVLFFVGLAAYIIFSSKIVVVKPSATKAPANNGGETRSLVKHVDQTELKNQYQTSARQAINEFSLLLAALEVLSTSSPQASSSDADKEDVLSRLSQLKISLLALTVPTSYKELHLGLVTALSQIQMSIESDEITSAFQEGEEHLKQMQSDHPWLM
jgi:hypothetical protein